MEYIAYRVAQHNVSLYASHPHHQGKPPLEMLHSILPGMSENRMHQHIGWYTEYITLLVKRKAAIATWRNERIVGSRSVTPPPRHALPRPRPLLVYVRAASLSVNLSPNYRAS